MILIINSVPISAKATTQLLLMIFGTLIIIGPIITLVWSIMDMIRILTKDQIDGNGYSITNKFS